MRFCAKVNVLPVFKTKRSLHTVYMYFPFEWTLFKRGTACKILTVTSLELAILREPYFLTGSLWNKWKFRTNDSFRQWNLISSVDLYKGDNFCDFLLIFCTQIPFWKGVCSNRKEFAPIGSKFFSFWVEPLFRWEVKKLTVTYESIFIPLYGRNSSSVADTSVHVQWTGWLNWDMIKQLRTQNKYFVSLISPYKYK